MIILKEKKDCVGCSACEQICPKHCIVMEQDEEGFLYPQVDVDLCIDCHLCEKVCPVLNDLKGETEDPITLGGYNKDELIREQSSSGGFFTLLAEYVIHQGGVVFGAKWNEKWEVVHDFTESMEGIAAFRGSKYVQSKMGNHFTQAKDFLKEGRLVLFSGTPCQIKGLKLFLRKDYDNLICADIICHGVPSPLIWQKYLDEVPFPQSSIKHISFRDKSVSWKNYNVLIESPYGVLSEPVLENIYMRGFLRDLYIRPSCYYCPSKAGKSLSDVTLGDFWGIQRIDSSFDDDRGISLVILNSKKLMPFLDNMSFTFKDFELEEAIKFNSSYSKCAVTSKSRGYFFTAIEKGVSVSSIVRKMTKVTFCSKVMIFFKCVIRKFIKL